MQGECGNAQSALHWPIEAGPSGLRLILDSDSDCDAGLIVVNDFDRGIRTGFSGESTLLSSLADGDFV